MAETKHSGSSDPKHAGASPSGKNQVNVKKHPEPVAEAGKKSDGHSQGAAHKQPMKAKEQGHKSK